MGIPQLVHRYTPAEYYRLEEEAEYKSEYYDGEIFAMAGASEPHIAICANLMREIGVQLKGTRCVVYGTDARLRLKGSARSTYPDVSVYCDARERDPEDASGHTFTNPTVLFEVLSPSTEMYDRLAKASHYRQIDSLQALVLVSQDAPRVEVYLRESDNAWSPKMKLDGIGESLRLPMIDVELEFTDIYYRVDFPSKK